MFSASRGVAGLPLDDDASALSVIIDLSRDYGTGAVDFDVTLEELHEDRSASRMRSLALVRMLQASSESPRTDVEALLAIIGAQRDAMANIQGSLLSTDET